MLVWIFQWVSLFLYICLTSRKIAWSAIHGHSFCPLACSNIHTWYFSLAKFYLSIACQGLSVLCPVLSIYGLSGYGLSWRCLSYVLSFQGKIYLSMACQEVVCLMSCLVNIWFIFLWPVKRLSVWSCLVIIWLSFCDLSRGCLPYFRSC